MSAATYNQFFITATGIEQGPYGYQCRLACGEPPEDANCDLENPDENTQKWLSDAHPDGCQSRLIDIHTGLGKTAGVVLAWLWNRVHHQNADWPRRLVYCLPMRTLVEQTAGNVEVWLWNLLKENPENQDLRWLCGFDPDEKLPDHQDPPTDRMRSPIVLMGGEDQSKPKREWDIWPEKPAILIGTQDMLLSRALNRGYGMSRYRWPMHFGLLNNDCLWVLDETQLMGVGIETSAQLQGLRHKLGMSASTSSWWMSATVDQSQLETVDFFNPGSQMLCGFELSHGERTSERVVTRFRALKSLARAPVAPASDKADDLEKYTDSLAEFVLTCHRAGTLTFVVVNRVHRAQAVFKRLRKQRPDLRIRLLHSRFRPEDRKRHEELLHCEGDRIIVATQAIEAGVDVSAATLITEVAPWSSLVQRFGRCNRYGEIDAGGKIYWIDLQPQSEKDSRITPYELADLQKASELLGQCTSASPADLKKVSYLPDPEIRPVIRRKDLLELFDTTPDLSGNDLDISRFVRDTDSADVQVYWRVFDPKQEKPSDELASSARRELCRVPFGSFVEFAKKQDVFRWDPLNEAWQDGSQNLVPGATYLLPLSSGGYRSDLGWTGSPKDQLTADEVISFEGSDWPETYDRDSSSFPGEWVRLEDHLKAVEETARKLGGALALDKEIIENLAIAGRWHDVGKAHPIFQDLLNASGTPPDDNSIWAKSERWGRFPESWRRGFRHELASALAWLQKGESASIDLIAFLIASHHGKVRISLRSLPIETGPDDPDRLYARGVWDGDELPEVELAGGTMIGPTTLDLSCMQLGESEYGLSWMDRMTSLRDDPAIGPFRLAFLETVLRAADGRASKIAISFNVDECYGRV